jgi:hypothetical protein
MKTRKISTASAEPRRKGAGDTPGQGKPNPRAAPARDPADLATDRDEALDEALKETFPASDPVSTPRSHDG